MSLIPVMLVLRPCVLVDISFLLSMGECALASPVMMSNLSLLRLLTGEEFSVPGSQACDELVFLSKAGYLTIESNTD